MKVLGISGSPRKGQTTDQLVQEVLEKVNGETEFISLAEKKISPCKACLQCAHENVCILKDDMTELRKKILEADVLVIGAPNYFDGINAHTHAFFERFYQFRHREAMLLADKPVVLVGTGGGDPEAPLNDMKRFVTMNGMKLVGTVSAQGVAGCFTCGYGENCNVGAVVGFFGSGTKITDEIIPSLVKQPVAVNQARAIGQQLNSLPK